MEEVKRIALLLGLRDKQVRGNHVQIVGKFKEAEQTLPQVHNTNHHFLSIIMTMEGMR